MHNFVSRALCAVVPIVLFSLVGQSAVAATCGVNAPNVTTAQYNAYRTGANLAETTLNPASVQTGFGYLGTLAPADGLIYAQPLILHNFTVEGTCYATVVFVATMENRIYAFDGDNLTSTTPIWKSKAFTTAVASGSVSYPALYCKSNVGFTTAGILSTPVIDSAEGLMYFVTLNDTQKVTTCTTTGSTGWVYTLHAMSLKSGSSFGLDYIPAHDINADLQPYGFVAGQQLQRPSLAGIAGSVLIGFGFGTSSSTGSELTTGYQGWMAEYSSCATNSAKCNASTCYSNTDCSFFLSTTATPGPLSPVGAGVWMSGAGPASDGTFYAYSTGNGCRPKASTTTTNCMALTENALGDSVIYHPHGANSNPGSTFTPENSTETPGYENYYVDDFNDLDISTGGVMMIPPAAPGSTSSYLLASGKAGQTYLLQTADLGGYTALPYQSFLSAASVAPCTVPFPVSPQTPLYSGIVPWKGGCAEIHGPAYWTLTGTAGFYFVWGFGDVPRGYFFNGATLDIDASDPIPPLAGTTSRGGGGALAISANGATRSTALLWAVTSDGFTSSGSFQNGALMAFQLYSSGGSYEIVPIFNSLTASGQVFAAQRYVMPLVNNGKVYVSAISPSNNGRIYVYGPCSQGPNGACGSQPVQ
jgi:hypothetical protein